MKKKILAGALALLMIAGNVAGTLQLSAGVLYAGSLESVSELAGESDSAQDSSMEDVTVPGSVVQDFGDITGEGVTITTEQIPDSTLYAAILMEGDQIYGNCDGVLTQNELGNVESLMIDMSMAVTTDFTGLELLTNLRYYSQENCEGFSDAELDLSMDALLEKLSQMENLRSLNVAFKALDADEFAIISSMNLEDLYIKTGSDYLYLCPEDTTDKPLF